MKTCLFQYVYYQDFSAVWIKFIKTVYVVLLVKSYLHITLLFSHFSSTKITKSKAETKIKYSKIA